MLAAAEQISMQCWFQSAYGVSMGECSCRAAIVMLNDGMLQTCLIATAISIVCYVRAWSDIDCFEYANSYTNLQNSAFSERSYRLSALQS